MTITAITCTGGRPEAFLLCQMWMARQTQRPVQWIVLDDGPVPAKCLAGQQHVYDPGFLNGVSLINKIRWLVEKGKIIGQGVCFIEDDDWYSPGWIASCASRLKSNAIVGEARALYYNVRHRWWFEHHNYDHASLCATAIRAIDIPRLSGLLNDPNPFLDERMWRSLPIPKMVFDNNPRMVIGMKGLPGRPGYGSGHGHTDRGARNDVSMNKLYGLIGQDADFYAPFYQP